MKYKKALILILLLCLIGTLASCSGDKYSVIFETNGGSAIDPVRLGKNAESFTMPDDPVKDGHIFVGWYFDNDTFSLPATVEGILAKFSAKLKSITIYAKWRQATIEEGTYLVNFETNGGSEIPPVSFPQGGTFSMPANPTRNGFSFGGWYFDNGTFGQDADVPSILAKLSPAAPYITVYAKWTSGYDDAFRYLSASLDVFYDGINAPDGIPSDAGRSRLVEIGELLSLSEDKTLSEHYADITGLLDAWDDDVWTQYKDFERYRYLIDKKTGQDLSEEVQAELEIIAGRYPDLGVDENDNYVFILNWLDGNQRYFGMTEQKLNLMEEFAEKAPLVMAHDTYIIKKAAYQQGVEAFITSISRDDIRADKINNIASLLAFYNYGELFKELSIDGKTETVINSADFARFIAEIPVVCELSKEDVGILVYKALVTYLDFAENGLDAKIAELNREMARYSQNPSLYPYDYGDYLAEQLAFAEENKAGFIDISANLSIDLVTDACDFMLGFIGIADVEKALDLLEPSDDDNAPTFAEAETMIRSVKAACDRLITSFGENQFASFAAALRALCSEVERGNTFSAESAAFIKALIPADSVAALGKISRVLNLVNAQTLDAFFKYELNPETNTYTYAPDYDYLFRNLAIFEAKFIVALTNGIYDAESFADSYDAFFAAFNRFLPYGLNHYDTSFGKDALSSASVSGAEFLSRLISEKVKDRIVFSAERYQDISEIASYEFVTSPSSSFPDDISCLVLIPEFEKFMMYTTLWEQVVDSCGTIYTTEPLFTGILGYNALTAGVLYSLEVDSDKLSAYADYMTTLSSFFSKPVNNKALLFAYAFDGLFKQERFTDEDVEEILTNLIVSLSGYMGDELEKRGTDWAEFVALIRDLAGDEESAAKISYALVSSYKLFSSLAISFDESGKSTSITQLADNFEHAREAASCFLSRYIEDDDWTSAINTLGALNETLYGIDGIGKYAEFLSVFLKAPDKSVSKLEDVLALFDTNTLNVFFEAVSEFDNPAIKLAQNRTYFEDNLVLLEARILAILIEQDFEDAHELYFYFTDFAKDFILSDLRDSFDPKNLESKLALIEKAIDKIIEKADPIFYFDSDRNARIAALSQREFLTDEDAQGLTEADYDAVIFCRILKNMLVYNQIVNDIAASLDDLYLTETEKEGYDSEISEMELTAIAAIAYLNDIDAARLAGFADYLSNLTAFYPVPTFDSGSRNVLVALIFDGLFEAGFTNDEIKTLIETFSDLILAYAVSEDYISENELATARAAVSTFSETALNIIRSAVGKLLYYNVEERIHKLNYENLTAISDDVMAELDALLEEYTDAESYDALTAFLRHALRGLASYYAARAYGYLTPEDYAAELSYIDTWLDVVDELISVDFSLKGIVGKLKAVIDEYLYAAAFELTVNENGLSENLAIFIAKATISLFGDNPDETYADAIAAAESNAGILEKNNAFLDMYDYLPTIASYLYDQYDDEPGFYEAIDAMNAFFAFAFGA